GKVVEFVSSLARAGRRLCAGGSAIDRWRRSALLLRGELISAQEVFWAQTSAPSRSSVSTQFISASWPSAFGTSMRAVRRPVGSGLPQHRLAQFQKIGRGQRFIVTNVGRE